MRVLYVCLALSLGAANPAQAVLVTWEFSGQFYDHTMPALASEDFHGTFIFNLENAATGSHPEFAFHDEALVFADLRFGADRLVGVQTDEMRTRVNNSYSPSSPPYDSMSVFVLEGDHANSGLYGDFMTATFRVEDPTMTFLDSSELEPAVLAGERWMEECCNFFSIRFWTDQTTSGFIDASGLVDSLSMSVPVPSSTLLLGVGLVVLGRFRRRAQRT